MWRSSDAGGDYGRAVVALCGGCAVRSVFLLGVIFVIGGGSIALSRRFGSEVLLVAEVFGLAGDVVKAFSLFNLPLPCQTSWSFPLQFIVVDPLHDLIAAARGRLGSPFCCLLVAVMLHENAQIMKGT